MLAAKQHNITHTIDNDGVVHLIDTAAWLDQNITAGKIRAKNTSFARQFINVVIGPTEASGFLLLNTHNRPMMKTHVIDYKNQMLNGKFRNESIILIAVDGTLIDGQHRLESIIQSGREDIVFSVCFGAQRDDFLTTDTGKLRSGADALAVAGLGGKGRPSPNSVSAALAAFKNIGTGVVKSGARPKISPSEIVVLHEQNPKIEECIAPARRLKLEATENCSPAGAAAAYYLIMMRSTHLSRNPADLEDFWEQLVKGTGPAFSSNSLDPIKRAYDYFHKPLPRDHATKTLNGKLHPVELIERTVTVIIVAWNLHVKGKLSKPLANTWAMDRNSDNTPLIF